MTRVLDPSDFDTDYWLARRLLTLAHVDLRDVTLDPITVHRNHIEFTVFDRGPDGYWRMDLRTCQLVCKTRVVRNPWPALAKETR